MNQHGPAADAPRRGPRTLQEAKGEAARRRREKARNLQHDERFDRLRTLPARRTLVIVGYLLAAASGALELTLEGLAGVWAPVAFCAGIGVAFILHRTLRATVDAPDEALDERLIAARDAAYRTAYRIVAWGLIGLLLLPGFVGFEVEQRHWDAFFWAFVLVVVLTPTAIRAWTEREV
jgi:hypothetical protein